MADRTGSRRSESTHRRPSPQHRRRADRFRGPFLIFILVVSCTGEQATAPEGDQSSREPCNPTLFNPHVATFVDQDVPDRLRPGESAVVSITMANRGPNGLACTPDWRFPHHKLASYNPELNTTWTPSHFIELEPDEVVVGDFGVKTFTFTITAPATQGEFDFQWRMYLECDCVLEGFFGQATPNRRILVRHPDDDADFVSQEVPITVGTDRNFRVAITMRNAGNAVWRSSSAHVLGSQDPARNLIWGSDGLPPRNAVSLGELETFEFVLRAPGTPGVYPFRWQMRRGDEFFGEKTPKVDIVVEGPPVGNAAFFLDQAVPPTMAPGERRRVSVIMENVGTGSWAETYAIRLGTQDPRDNILWTGASRVLMNPGEIVHVGDVKDFSFDITAPQEPGDYSFQWRMVEDVAFPDYFGHVTPRRVIRVRPDGGDAQIRWMREDFEGLAVGPVAGQGGWRADGASAKVVSRNNAHHHILRVDPDPGAVISISKDVPDRVDRRQTIKFAVKVRGATTPSVAKLIVASPGGNWNKKFQVYFGESIRVNYRPGGATRTIVESTDPKHWYRIRLEVDMGSRLLDAYVDGVLAASGLSLLPGPITEIGVVGWDRPGLVLLDDLIGREN